MSRQPEVTDNITTLPTGEQVIRESATPDVIYGFAFTERQRQLIALALRCMTRNATDHCRAVFETTPNSSAEMERIADRISPEDD